ncbi:hypothetical protein [Mucilaginibacter sp.]|uniref:hypothetical protein n=1 Tax=Mucilaginibacter sp. TaxID=1882438 RepID=UPI0035BC507D
MKQKVLIAVTTYPLPSRSYDELVCTAGVLEDGTWIRIYPIPFKFLQGLRQDNKVSTYKYTWIELELNRRKDDFRPESHSPVRRDFSDVTILDSISTKGTGWSIRHSFVAANVYTDMSKLIEQSKKPTYKSLATFKPASFTGFEWKEEKERDWKPEWKDKLKQLDMFLPQSQDGSSVRKMIPKLPYKFYYRFADVNGKPSRLMIEDWEIGVLFFKCLRDYGSETLALEKVKQKYWDEFMSKNDIYLFLGTTKTFHAKNAPNPFVIIGVFYPPLNMSQPKLKPTPQLSLFA